MQTIELIRADDDLELDYLTVSNLKTSVKPLEGKTVTSPTALSFQATILIKLGKIHFGCKDNVLVQIFEILLSLAILLGSDLKSKVSENLLTTCVEIVR